MKKIKPLYKRLFIVCGVLLAMGVGIALYVGIAEYNYRFRSAVIKSGTVQIYPGTSFQAVATMLQKREYIKSADKMVAWGRTQQRDTALAGNYTLTQGESYRTLLGTLTFGRQSPVRLTFNNARTLENLAARLTKNLLTDSVQMLRAMRDDSLQKIYGLTDQTIAWLFIPNTYEVYWTITPAELIEKMNKEHHKFWNSTRTSQAEELGFSPLEISIIASIVYQETKVPSDMTPVAGVYINRLRKGMLLQADPTVKFAVGDPTLKRVLHKHLAVESPYNTYKNKGLPVGPICVPPIEAIDATLAYKGHDYYYFCASADLSGTTQFSRTLADHNRHARAYQQELNRRKIK